MIETPTVTAINIDSPDADETDTLVPSGDQRNNKNSATEPEILIVKTKPITAKIRTTMKHLRAQAGTWAPFRGLHIFIVYQILYALVLTIFHGIFKNLMIPRPASAVITSLVLAQCDLMWTHVVISAPSTLRWYSRIPRFESVKQILVPAFLYAVSQQVVISIPAILIWCFGLQAYLLNPDPFALLDKKIQKQKVAEVFIVGLVGILAGFLILFPASVSLTRVYASILPDEDESIVPFDRTFGGRVEAKIVGGSGRVSVLDAWKTFDWSARIRLVKLYVKVFAIEFAVTILCILILAAQLTLIVGKPKGKGTGPQ